MGADKKRKRGSDAEEALEASEDYVFLEKPARKRQQQRRTLFVRSLPKTATTETLIAHFSESFPIRHATAVTDPATKECKGFGFITFADEEDAARARAELDNSVFESKKIRLEVAEPRKRDVEDGMLDGPKPSKSKSQPSAALKEAKAKRDQQTLEDRRPPKLIVRNLPWSIKTTDDLSKLFMSFGKVKLARLPTTKSGTLQGFGFITLRGKKNAEKAMERMNGKEIDGRSLAVDWAVEKDLWARSQQQDSEKPVIEDATEESDDPFDELRSEPSDVPSISDDRDTIDTDERDEAENGLSIDDERSDESSDEDGASEDHSSTLFVRNLPFSCSDETLNDHFSQFGALRYARVVLDPATERPRGVGFVCFFNVEQARDCLKGAPRGIKSSNQPQSYSKPASASTTRSILQNEESDPEGRYTIEGRILQLSAAVNKSEAARLTDAGVARRDVRDKDKRRLYLLSEGTISQSSALYNLLPQSERDMREASAKQRKRLVQNNPSLHLSLTRLSIRNIPRFVTSKDLKTLAREAVVEFAKGVKAGDRQPLSKEELSRGGLDMREKERKRKLKKSGIVKQAKVVFEDREGHKVTEGDGAGRSRGYGFVEYHSHRSALMGLRWLNGHATKPPKTGNDAVASKPQGANERTKRLIAEFAVENAQVVNRRKEIENKSKIKPRDATAPDGPLDKAGAAIENKTTSAQGAEETKVALEKQQRIIARKRSKRSRKGVK